MINLIPNHEKKKKVKDFYFRLGVVFIAVLGFCGVAGIASLLPSLFLTETEKSIAHSELSAQKSTQAEVIDPNLAATVSQINKKLAIIESARKEKYFISHKIIREVALRRMADIKIERIAYEKDSAGAAKVTLSGVAPSRERLLLFRQALESSAAWRSVDLPISNFVRGADIPFNLTLIPS